MTVVMATVGFQASKVVPAIDAADAKEELVLFYDKDSKENAGRSKAAARELEQYARKLGLPCSPVEINAFDLVDSCQQVRREIRKRRGKDIVVSIGAGTRVLASAGLLASILEGVRVVHVSEKDGSVQPLPMLRLDAGSVLNAQKRRVLAHIRAHPGCLQRDVAAGLGLTKGTVSHHVKGLVRQGIVEARPEPSDTRTRRLHAVPSADLLLME
jgi:CRISPR locus-related DNA-binding protein